MTDISQLLTWTARWLHSLTLETPVGTFVGQVACQNSHKRMKGITGNCGDLLAVSRWQKTARHAIRHLTLN
jgi:hypothetical protein